MIVPKDGRLIVDVSADRASFSWLPPKGDKWSYGSMFWLFGAMFALVYFVPGEFVERPFGFLLTSAILFGVGILAFWLGSRAKTTITAFQDGIAVKRVPFTKWRSKTFESKPVQFYLSAGLAGQSSVRYGRALCLIGHDGVSHTLVTGLNQTMASQLWYELQEFYELEDLEVLGELNHQHFTDFRRSSRSD